MTAIIQQPVSRCTEFTLNGVDRTFLTATASLAPLAEHTARIWNRDLGLTGTVFVDIESAPKGFMVHITKIGETPDGDSYYELMQSNVGDSVICSAIKINVRVYKDSTVPIDET